LLEHAKYHPGLFRAAGTTHLSAVLLPSPHHDRLAQQHLPLLPPLLVTANGINEAVVGKSIGIVAFQTGDEEPVHSTLAILYVVFLVILNFIFVFLVVVVVVTVVFHHSRHVDLSIQEIKDVLLDL
jgi:hypothetical protein